MKTLCLLNTVSYLAFFFLFFGSLGWIYVRIVFGLEVSNVTKVVFHTTWVVCCVTVIGVFVTKKYFSEYVEPGCADHPNFFTTTKDRYEHPSNATCL